MSTSDAARQVGRLLLDHGHPEPAIRAATECDEWFCAKGTVGEVCRAPGVAAPDALAGREPERLRYLNEP
ncbi:hypothetical protein [Streptomyces sp. CAU 1734]|uniref:hypothetical protein n=1 Tax=Streptomyces sp. CAU 1734 TaxID=3140360 RepID=UPI003260AE35